MRTGFTHSLEHTRSLEVYFTCCVILFTSEHAGRFVCGISLPRFLSQKPTVRKFPGSQGSLPAAGSLQQLISLWGYIYQQSPRLPKGMRAEWHSLDWLRQSCLSWMIYENR